MNQKATVIFMGTPEFAVPIFNALIEDGYKVELAVTQPDRPKGRGGKPAPPPVKVAAAMAGVPVLQPEKAGDAYEAMAALSPGVIVTAAYGCILRENVLSLPRLGCVNVHASLLPKYRGASPIHQAILNGDAKTGVTTMMMDKGVDTGGVLLQDELGISQSDCYPELCAALAALGARTLLRTLPLLACGKIAPRPQDNSLATYAPAIRKEDGALDFTSMGACGVANRVRAFAAWPGAYAALEYGGAAAPRRMRVLAAEPEPDAQSGSPMPDAQGSSPMPYTHGGSPIPDAQGSSPMPGAIVSCGRAAMRVVCADRRCVAITRVQFDGGRPLPIAECWHNIPADARLTRLRQTA